MTNTYVFYRQRIWCVIAERNNFLLLRDRRRKWDTQWVHQRLVILLTAEMEKRYVDTQHIPSNNEDGNHGIDE